MAWFDESTRQIVVRIVYDGAGTAGKTTNLQQLTTLLTPSRRGELVTPETTQGRTLFFDWLRLEGGLIAGYRFRCELLTVPGQLTLRARREHLLRDADVVVFVIDSTQAGIDEGKALFRDLRNWEATRAVPLLVQANKQDLPGAAQAPAIRRVLDLDAEVSIIEAQADAGIGVRDTALLAMRQAAMHVQEALIGKQPTELPNWEASPESMTETLRALRMTASLLDDEAVPGATPMERDGAQSGPPTASAPKPVAAAGPTDGPPDTAPTTAAAGVTSDQARRGALALMADAAPLPTADVPSRHIWPAAAGRETVRRLQGQSPELVAALTQQQGKRDGSGKPDTLVFRVGDLCLKTSPRRRFDRVEAGESALIGLARSKVLLGALMVPDTVLVLQDDDAGGMWLWTLSPWAPSLRSDMAGAEQRKSRVDLLQALKRYVDASFHALSLTRDKGLLLDISPSNFAFHAGAVRYLDDDIAYGRRIPGIGHAWLKRVDEYAQAYDVVEQYVAELEARIPETLGHPSATSLGLLGDLEQTLVVSEAGKDARRRLEDAVRRCR